MALTGSIGAEIVWRADSATGPTYWANRLEFTAPALGVGVTPELLAEAIRDGFLPMVRANYWMDHVVLSSYAPDGQPYDPSTFYVLPVATRGTLGDGPQPTCLPLSNVLHIKKLTGSGRLGDIFLRGALLEEDITSDNNGGVTLTTIAAWQTRVDTLFDGLETALAGAATLSMISGSGLGIASRDVTGLFVKGITHRNLRTKRKTRVVSNSLSSMQAILADGGVTIDEIPAFVLAATEAARALGVALPPLLP